MPIERWSEIKRILQSINRLQPAERLQEAKKLCEPDDGLWTLGERFFRAAAELGTDDYSSPANQSTIAFQPGEAIGDLTVQEFLGRGGMGDVYLASQPFGKEERLVAVKVLRHHDSRTTPSDFYVGRLTKHPNLAEAYGVDRLKDGTFYLVMEYVNGVQLLEYFDHHQATWADRIRTMVQVCDAVAHAHSYGIIHRDLKPTNVLVSDDGVPKVVDFSIAKDLDQDSTEGSYYRKGTLAFMAPEQIGGVATSTATDTYALGILLFLVLTGKMPYSSRSDGELQIEIMDDRQVPRLGSSNLGDAEAWCAPPKEAPRKLRRLYRSDMADIVAKATHKDPRHRYLNAASLRDDLLRHFKNKPVSVRAKTPLYTARLFTKRRPGIAAVLIGVLLLGAGWASTAQRAATERRSAALQQARAEHVSGLMELLFEHADPWRLEQREVGVRELLKDATERVSEQLADQPVAAVDILTSLASVYTSLAWNEDAKRAVAEAEAILTGGPQAPTVTRARLLNETAKVNEILGSYNTALALARQAVELAGTLDDEQFLLDTRETLASILDATGEYDESISTYEQVLASRRTNGQNPLLAFRTMKSLAAVLETVGEPDRAEDLLREALQGQRQRLGEHPDVADTLSTLATSLDENGKTQEAEKLYRQALKILEDQVGREHPAVANAYNDLGVMYFFRGDLDNAETNYNTALSIQADIYDGEHIDIAQTRQNLAMILEDRGDFDLAEKHLQNALAIRTELLGDQHELTANTLNSLGFHMQTRRRFEEAESYFRQALAMRTEALGADHEVVAEAHNNLGVLLHEMGLLEDAIEEFDQGLNIAQSSLDSGDTIYLALLKNLAEAQSESGNCEAAIETLEQVIPQMSATFGENHWRKASAELSLAECLLKRGLLDRAEKLLLTAAPILAERWGKNAPITQRAYTGLTTLYSQSGHLESAERYRQLLVEPVE